MHDFFARGGNNQLDSNITDGVPTGTLMASQGVCS